MTSLAIAGCGPMHGAPEPPPARAQGSSGPPGTTSGPDPVDDPWRGAGPTESLPASEPAGSARPGNVPAAGGRGARAPSAEAQLLLDAHNRYRAEHCAPPLTWSPELAAFAQRWANTLRDKGCAFEHSRGTYGENLAAGTTGALDPRSVVAMWYDEIADYSFAKPAFSTQTGHFTQVVWRGTQRLGCAMTQCKGMDIWVCEYDPPGNWEGRYREHVLPSTCKR